MTDNPNPPAPQAANSPSSSSTPSSPSPSGALPPGGQLNLPPEVWAQIIAAQAAGKAPRAPIVGPGGGVLFPMAGAAAHMHGVLQQSWQGPYPPPEAVERYEKVQPGAFNRIIAMAENIQAAQIKQSADALSYQYSESRRGQWLGFSVGIVALVGAAVLGFVGHSWLAAAFLAVPVIGLAKSLVESARQAKDNDRQPLAAPAQPSAPVQPQKAPGGDVNKTE